MYFDAQGGRIRTWFSDVIASGGEQDPVLSAAIHFGIAEERVREYMDHLVETGWFVCYGDEERTVYGFGDKREIVRTYCQQSLDVVYVWETFFRPFFAFSPNVQRIVRFGFTEMMRNAFEHSGAERVTGLIRSVDGLVTICIMDDGVGIFEGVAKKQHLPDKRMVALELAKGRLSSQQGNCSGENLFLTSRLFDLFALRANAFRYACHTVSTDGHLSEKSTFSADSYQKGTTAVMMLPMGSKRTFSEVRGRYAGDDSRAAFFRTSVPVKLVRLDYTEALLSREQAARLLERLACFSEVTLDFSDVTEIGLDFADEIFRIFARVHPEVHLKTVNASPAVQKIIRYVER